MTSSHIVTGLSVAFDTFVEGLRERSIPHQVINAGVGVSVKSAGVFSVRRMLGVLTVLLKFLCNLRRADIVYVTMGSSNFGFMRDFFIVHTTALFHRRLVLHLHGGGYGDFYHQSGPWLQVIIRRTLNRVDTIIVLGDLLRDQFNFLSREYGPEIVVVPNGLPGDENPWQGAKNLPEEKPLRLLYLSNMIASKGYLQVLEACRILRDRAQTSFVCDFAGEFMSTGSASDGVEPEQAHSHFFELIEQFGLMDAVRYHGLVRGREKQDLLSGAHVFLLPTRYSGEGQPISIIEALSQGVPVVTTRFRGIPEQIEDGENGILLDLPTAKNIADAIEVIIHNRENYQCMSCRAHEIFQERFTRVRFIDRLIPAVLGVDLNFKV